MPARTIRLCRVTLLPLALLAGALAVPGQAMAAKRPGTIEVCKVGQDGVTGTFQFRLNGGAAFSVPVGGCSGPMSAPAGKNTVSELAPSDGSIQVVDISARPAGNLVSANLDGRSAVVKVKKGSTVANETLVTFTNGRPPGTLKVCKVAGDAGLLGDLFSFTENGGPAFSVAAGSAPAGNCSNARQFDIGTVVNVHELPVAGTHVSSIAVSDGRGSGLDPGSASGNVTIGPGVTTITFTNVFNPPNQTGFIEVCKEASDAFTSGTFHFTIAGNGFSTGRDVQVGQCSDPIRVPAGVFTVSETAKGVSVVTAITASPAERLLGTNLINRTATVNVVASDDSSDETLVTFFNAQQTGQFKICKTLASNAGALAGSTFTFDVSAPSAGVSQTFTVVAGAAGTTACRLFPTALPLGTAVSVGEEGQPNVQVTGVSVSPADRDTGSFGSTASFTIGSGITTATFTNQALGTIEVCKNAADASTATQTFQFSINGGAAISVHAGQCSPAISVPAGTATVRELGRSNFSLVSVSANGGRLLSGPTDNPASVSVPFGGVANETVVTFTNQVNTGQFKLCKQSPEPTLQGVPFTFTFSYTVNGTLVTGSATLKPGECSALSPDLPVVDASGNPIRVDVSEAPTATVQVSAIDYAGAGSLVARNLGAGTASFTVGQGTNILTYTNVRTPLAAKLLRLPL